MDAIIHVASPIAPGRDVPEATVLVKGTIEGTLNVLRRAVKAGDFKVVLTSSWVTTIDPSFRTEFTDVTLTEKSWGNTSREDLLADGRKPLYVYIGSKILAISQPIAGNAGRPLPPQLPPYYCNVYDVARAHVLALKLPKLRADSDVQDKRFIIAGPGVLLWENAVKVLMEARPELKDRLLSVDNVAPLPGPSCKVDTTRAQEVLGITEYRGREETMLETVDAIIDLENTSTTKPRY
ncbi:hypothetical protein C8Q73DRAFT_791225 [Cubamyces lactineus]|nr:hypothetical protein C8Q73DRAFT_791225 [Cubamyces lactineus]